MPAQTELESSHQDSTNRNGSPSIILWLISGLLFIAGTALAVGLWFQTAQPGQPIPSHYVETRCTVLDKDVDEVKVHDDNPDQTTQSNDSEDVRIHEVLASVQIRYFVNGEEYEIWTFHGAGFKDRAEAEAEIADFVIGEEYPCWYDPKYPKHALLKQNDLGVIVAVVMGLIGLVGLGYCSSRSIFAHQN